MKSSLPKFIALIFVAALALASAAAQAATSGAFAAFTGISVTTDGTASVLFTESPADLFFAQGLTDGGTPDAGNDGMFFDSEFSALGEGTATNGFPGAFTTSTSIADAEALPGNMRSSSAQTLVDLEMELSGTGNVTIDIDYDLEVDTLNNLPDGFATASINAFTTFAGPESAALDLTDSTGFLSDSGTLTLSFFVDDLGLGEPSFDFLTVETFADVKASAVPLPASAVLLAPALAGLAGFRRRG